MIIDMEFMSSPKLYLRFITSLGFGLAGLAAVLKVLMDRVFNDWDAIASLKRWLDGFSARSILVDSHRTEDVLIQAEKDKSNELTTRLIDRRREELRAMDAIEHRLQNLPKPSLDEGLPPGAPLPAKAPPAAPASARNPIYQEDWGP